MPKAKNKFKSSSKMRTDQEGSSGTPGKHGDTHTQDQPDGTLGGGPSNCGSNCGSGKNLVSGAPPVKKAENAEGVPGQEQTKAKKQRSKKKGSTPHTPAPAGLDPVAFFTQQYSMPHVLNRIMDYANVDDYWEAGLEEKLERKMRPFAEHSADPFWEHPLWHEQEHLFLSKLPYETIKRCVLTMLKLEYVTGFYKAPSSFGVNRAWRGIMLERVGEGKQQEYVFREKLERSRQAVLSRKTGGKKKKMKKLQESERYDSDTCVHCSAIFLDMIDVELKKKKGKKQLYSELCAAMDFFNGLDICGRHVHLRREVEDGLYWDRSNSDLSYEEFSNWTDEEEDFGGYHGVGHDELGAYWFPQHYNWES